MNGPELGNEAAMNARMFARKFLPSVRGEWKFGVVRPPKITVPAPHGLVLSTERPLLVLVIKAVNPPPLTVEWAKKFALHELPTGKNGPLKMGCAGAATDPTGV